MNISSLPLEPIGATGIVSLVVLLILRGTLIPRRVHLDRMADKDAQIEYYHTALEREAERNDALSGQLDALMEVARTADHVLSSLPHVGGSSNELAS